MDRDRTQTAETQPSALPDCLISVSWEVCNKVGGIYTVLSTQAKELNRLLGGALIYIGPDFGQPIGELRSPADKATARAWEAAAPENIPVRIGRWEIPGRPWVVLVDWLSLYSEKNEVYGKMWSLFGVDSLRAYGDYDESSMFGLAAGRVAKALSEKCFEGKQVVLQVHEWMSAFALFEVKATAPRIKTIFTTHATSIGRSITSNNKQLYAYFDGYHGDQMARELCMEAKHSAEKRAALAADVMTTVSHVTDRECARFLERQSDVILPNGFESAFVPRGKAFDELRTRARERTLRAANRGGRRPLGDDALIVCTSGRMDYRCKGYDVVLDALARLQERELQRDVLMVIAVPYWSDECLRLAHSSNERFRLLIIPRYLNGSDGVVDLDYYDWLVGVDLALYPSYYEPWGYTPLEAAAFGVPTITTDLAGFGVWVQGLGDAGTLSNGVEVLHRDDGNYMAVCNRIADDIEWLSRRSEGEIGQMRRRCRQIAAQAGWKDFIKYYEQALRLAMGKE